MRNDGKYLEIAVQTELAKLVSKDLIFIRMYDSYSAKGNPLPAQPADYMICYQRMPMFLELKTTGNKNGRLPKNSFPQLPVMRAWSIAGFPGFLLCHCYGFDSELYLVNVISMDPSQKSWVIPDIGRKVLVTNFLEYTLI